MGPDTSLNPCHSGDFDPTRRALTWGQALTCARVEPGDILVERQVEEQNVVEIFTQSWWGHAGIFLGWFDTDANGSGDLSPMIADAFPSRQTSEGSDVAIVDIRYSAFAEGKVLCPGSATFDPRWGPAFVEVLPTG